MADKAKDKKKEEGEEEEAQPGGKKKLFIIVGAVLVLAIAGGAFFMMGGSGEEGEPEEVDLGPPGLVNMETFMVNIYHPEGDRHARLKLDLTVLPADIGETIAADALLQAKLRDRVLTLLTSKTFEELRSPVGKESFRREVKSRLNPLLEDGSIEEVLFSEFVVQ